MFKTQEELVKEEQKILDDLIREMDSALLRVDDKLTESKLQALKAKTSCLPDAYGMLVSAEHEKMTSQQRMRDLRKGKDELYETRLVLDVTDDQGSDCEEIKVGLHTYMDGPNIFIMSWKREVCRHYILDNAAEEYDGIVDGKNGEKYKTHYQLRLKRQVSISFDKVKSVTHFFPTIAKEVEQVIADEFLRELSNRRSSQEFKNIVFSIQRKQGEIIQTPFDQNMIVQGCAGSGKSMIMLHRLPIVLYDNPNSLDRNNLYIITPSITYIQMANNMRMDLEIEDLKMGTLQQYYNYVLGKYRLEPETYGEIKPYLKLNKEDLRYVYSAKCVEDIRRRIGETIDEDDVDCKGAYAILNMEEPSSTRGVDTPADRLRDKILKIQAVLNQNDSSLRSYHQDIYNLLEQLSEFAETMEGRKNAILRDIKTQINDQKKIVIDNEEDIRKIDNRKEHKVMYQNRMNSIQAAQNKIADLNETLEIAILDDSYFEELKKTAKTFRQMLSLFAMVKSERSEMALSEQYKAIANTELLCAGCGEIIRAVTRLGDPYMEYTKSADSVSSGIRKLEPLVARLGSNNSAYLPEDYLEQLMDARAKYADIADRIVKDIYLSLMKRLGQEPDKRGRLDALECSPYLYLQIMYQFNGAPNAARESLITIDEAQNMEPEELRLIKAVNGNSVVLNLFGDVKQHIEDSKGIDDWEQIADIASFKKEYMQENYRNVRQITEYCNKRFKLSMRAINIDGAGVHELKCESEFESAFTEIFQHPANLGLSGILVKNKEEADALLAKAGAHAERINNMTGEILELQKTKWNLMTTEQAKGLEFSTVFAVTGRMSENEKYIAYTRALNELYVYDAEIELPKVTAVDPSQKAEKKPMEGSTRRKREKRASKSREETTMEKGLKAYFEEKGLTVIDDRKKSGHLWVIGSRNEIDSIVREAMEIYGITGSYGSGKISGFKDGWFTKSKK